MKKVFLFAAVAVMLTLADANAQGFEWGAKAGVNVAWLTVVYAPMEVTGEIENKDRVGFYAGVFAEQTLNKWLGVQGELLYMQMGDRGKMLDAHNIAPGTDIGYGDIYFGRKFDYLVLPLLAKVYVWKGISVDLGPQLGYLVSAKHKNIGSMYTYGRKKFDFSIVAGLSYRVTNHLDLSARLNRGLTTLDGSSDGGRNISYSLGAGWRF